MHALRSKPQYRMRRLPSCDHDDDDVVSFDRSSGAQASGCVHERRENHVLHTAPPRQDSGCMRREVCRCHLNVDPIYDLKRWFENINRILQAAWKSVTKWDRTLSGSCNDRIEGVEYSYDLVLTDGALYKT